VIVRSWNLFHGNTHPPGRRAYLKEMLQLVTADDPGVVLLQEVPLWALPQLERWSGMRAVGDVAAAARLGPLPSTPGIGKALTGLHSGLLRSALTGQGNAILAARRFQVVERRRLVLNDRNFRRAQTRWLRLGLLARLVWAKERRVLQAVRFRDGNRTIVVGNMHATSCPPDPRIAEAELFRAAVFVDGLARPSEPVILGGDLNVRADKSYVLAELEAPPWLFARFGHSVDHVLVRGLELKRGLRWPEDRRRHDAGVLSDHVPIEIVVDDLR
jgi:endonuclease/exonuclease/phosphatase family metal-dependent hydrolase